MTEPAAPHSTTSILPRRPANGSAPRAWRPPVRETRAMSIGVGVFLITAGAILRFALPAGSPLGLNVHMLGVILILAGGLGLLLPRIARAPWNRLRPLIGRKRSATPDDPPSS